MHLNFKFDSGKELTFSKEELIDVKEWIDGWEEQHKDATGIFPFYENDPGPKGLSLKLNFDYDSGKKLSLTFGEMKELKEWIDWVKDKYKDAEGEFPLYNDNGESIGLYPKSQVEEDTNA